MTRFRKTAVLKMLKSFLGLRSGNVRDLDLEVLETEHSNLGLKMLVGVGADPYFSESDMKVNGTSASTVNKLLA
jgi:hypothetical protein